MNALSDLFTAGARRYDLLVGANPGYHRHLRLAAARIARWARPARVLDLGCGTGASTRALLAELPGIDVLGIDASAGMVDRARRRGWPTGRVRFLVGRAGDRSLTAGEERADAALAAYLLRNIPPAERDDVLRAVHDQLAPGGVLAIQDYSVRVADGTGALDRRACAVWDAVCWGVVIPLAALVQRDTRLYRYLWRSVRGMEDVGAWCARLRAAGFEVLELHPGAGWQRGILHTVIARRQA